MDRSPPQILLQFLTIVGEPLYFDDLLVVRYFIERLQKLNIQVCNPALQQIITSLYVNTGKAILSKILNSTSWDSIQYVNLLGLLIRYDGIRIDFSEQMDALSAKALLTFNQILEYYPSIYLYFLKNHHIHQSLGPKKISALFEYHDRDFVLGLFDIPELVRFVGWHSIIQTVDKEVLRNIYSTPEYFVQLQIKDLKTLAEEHPEDTQVMLETLVQTPSHLAKAKPPRSMQWLGMAFDALCPVPESSIEVAYQDSLGIQLDLVAFGLQYGACSAVELLKFDSTILTELSEAQLEKIITRQGRGPKFGELDKKIPNDFLPDEVLEQLTHRYNACRKENKSKANRLLRPIQEIGEQFYDTYRLIKESLAKEVQRALQSAPLIEKYLSKLDELSKKLIASAWALKKSLKNLPQYLRTHPDNRHLERGYDEYIELMGVMAEDLKKTFDEINEAMGSIDGIGIELDTGTTQKVFNSLQDKLLKSQRKLIEQKPQTNTLGTRPFKRHTSS